MNQKQLCLLPFTPPETIVRKLATATTSCLLSLWQDELEVILSNGIKLMLKYCYLYEITVPNLYFHAASVFIWRISLTFWYGNICFDFDIHQKQSLCCQNMGLVNTLTLVRYHWKSDFNFDELCNAKVTSEVLVLSLI